jgi:hypothetical protein
MINASQPARQDIPEVFVNVKDSQCLGIRQELLVF